MKNVLRKKLFLISSIISIMMTFCISTVFAEESNIENEKIILEVTEELDSIKSGDEINIKIKTKKESENDFRLDSIEAVLEYDKDILEIVGNSSNELIDLDTSTGWDVSMRKDNGKILGIRAEVKETDEVATITFKVKDGVDTENTTIKLNNIEVMNPMNIYSNQENIELKIGEKSIWDNKNLIIIIAVGIAVIIILIIIIAIMKKKKSK